MTLSYAHKLPVFFLVLLLLPLSVLSDEPQCASLQQAAGSDAFELNQRIEDPLIPNTGDITNTIPTFAELSDMSLLTDDADAMKQFESMPTPPSAVAPLIMLHPNTDGLKLNTIEVAAISTNDCVPGLIESQGQQVVCTETSVGDNPFKGDFIFRYYELQGETITQVKEATFSINSESFLPIHNKSLNLDGTPLEGKKLIARGLLVDVSSEGIVPPLDKPSYVSLQYIPTEHSSSSTSKADKFIYLPFSQAALSHTSANPSDSDYAQFTMNGNFARQKVHSAGSPIAHFAARYTLSTPTNLGIQFVSDCNHLQTITGGTVVLEGDIDCEDASLSPITLTSPISFDGGGYTISNVAIVSAGTNNVGLFATLPAGSLVKDLTLEGFRVTGIKSVGSLAGISGDFSFGEEVTIDNVNVTKSASSISKVMGNNDIGGLIGIGYNTRFINSSTDTMVLAKCETAGGLAGKLYNSNILRSYSRSTVSSTSRIMSNCSGTAGGLAGEISHTNISESYQARSVSGGIHSGGLVGIARDGSAVEHSLFNGISYSGGDGYLYSGEDKFTGGLVGRLEFSTINESHVRGSIQGEQFAGGLVGIATYNSYITNSLSDAEIYANRSTMDIDVAPAFIANALENSSIENCHAMGYMEIHTEWECRPSGLLTVCTDLPAVGAPSVCTRTADGSSSADCVLNSNGYPDYGRELKETWNSFIWDISSDTRQPKLKNTRGPYGLR